MNTKVNRTRTGTSASLSANYRWIEGGILAFADRKRATSIDSIKPSFFNHSPSPMIWAFEFNCDGSNESFRLHLIYISKHSASFFPQPSEKGQYESPLFEGSGIFSIYPTDSTVSNEISVNDNHRPSNGSVVPTKEHMCWRRCNTEFGRDSGVFGEDPKASGKDYASFGKDHEALGKDHASFGKDRESFGKDRETTGSFSATCVGRKNCFGEDTGSLGKDRKCSGKDRESFGKDRENLGKDRESFGRAQKSCRKVTNPAGKDGILFDKHEFINLYINNLI
jgi:hypothetical protein